MSGRGELPVLHTPTGFCWGAAEVVRVTHDKRRGWVVIAVRSFRRAKLVDEIEVLVMKGGKIRILGEQP